jgi:hypothetical protein
LTTADANQLRSERRDASELGAANAHQQVTIFRLLAWGFEILEADDRSAIVSFFLVAFQLAVFVHVRSLNP